SWHWPVFSGQVVQNTTSKEDHPFGEDMTIPCFSEQEWEDIGCYCRDEALADLNIPGLDLFSFYMQRSEWSEGGAFDICTRRTSAPDYGRFIVSGTDLCDTCPDGELFVKRGWGNWCVVEFNDGKGGRVTRRFFQHVHYGATLIRQA